jgi:FAD:protein FMN transferase
MEWALAELERLEQCWSRFRPDSELAHLHRHAGSWTHVSATLLRALTCAVELHHVTGGRFDPTILAMLEDAGYDRSFELVAPRDDDARPFTTRAAPGFARVAIDVDASSVLLPRGVRLDLGGVGKGLAADLVARGLIDRGARTVLVGLGGDLRARGEPPPDGAWDVPVEDPRDEQLVAFRYPLVAGALVTSTTAFRHWTRHGRRYHHIIDPATGDSARTGVTAVVAAATDAWFAEGIAKSILIAGRDQGVALARTTGVHTWLFTDDGRVVEVQP